MFGNGDKDENNMARQDGRKQPIKIVTQSWTHGLPYMQQTVLLTAVRGPDGAGKYHPSKYMLRWFRRCTLICALEGIALTTPHDKRGGSFTGPSYTGHVIGDEWQHHMETVFSAYLKSLDELPHHFQLHFMHAAEIVGFKHPDIDIREWWRMVYFELARDMHLRPELESELDRRLGDDESQWRDSNHVATQE